MSKSVNVFVFYFFFYFKKKVCVLLCVQCCVLNMKQVDLTRRSLLKSAQHQNEQTSFSVLQLLFLV